MLNKVTDYKIVTSADVEVLEEEVRTALNDGWTPSGPLLPHKNFLSQAMVKFDS
jgi:hypothetical protein